MSLDSKVEANRANIQKIIDDAKNISGLPPLAGLVNLQDEIALEVKSSGQTVKTSIAQLIDGGVGTSIVKHTLMIPFDFVQNEKNVITNIHGGLIEHNNQSGIALNSGQSITTGEGISKTLINVVAGSVINGVLTITGTSVDRNTGVETVGDSEDVIIDSLTLNNSVNDANGNPTYDVTNGFITSKWWKSTVTITTTDLNLTNVLFYQLAFEQFNDRDNVEIQTFDMSYKTNDDDAEMDSYLYAVEVLNGKVSVQIISELHHETAEEDVYYRRRKGNINKDLNCTTDGIFVDMFLLPLAQKRFESMTCKVWGTSLDNINVVVDGSLGLDSIVYGENLQVGDVAYLNADGKYYIASNISESTSTTELRLIIEAGVTDDNKISLSKGQYTGSGFTAGLEFLGVNGTITSSRPTQASETVRILSTSINATTRYFDPSKTWINGTASKINGVELPGFGTEFLDNVFKIVNSANQTRKVKFNLDEISANTERTLTVQDKDGVVAYLSDIVTGVGIPEAPIDGKEYNRKDGGWVEDTGGGTLQSIDEVLKTGSNITEEDLVFDKGDDANVTITDEAIIATDTENNRISKYKADKIVYINDGDTKELHLPQPLTLLESETIATQEWTVLAKINSIGYPELKDIFTTKIDLGVGLNLDWDISPLYYKTLTVTPTAITQNNYKVGMGKMLMLTGAFSYSIQHCDIIVDEGNFDGALWNLFQIFCIDDTVGSEKFTCNHIRTFTI